MVEHKMERRTPSSLPKVGVLRWPVLGRPGETMAVAFVLGNNHKIAIAFDAASTITVSLANEFTEDSDLFTVALLSCAFVRDEFQPAPEVLPAEGRKEVFTIEDFCH
jgi:hypothetical protein